MRTFRVSIPLTEPAPNHNYTAWFEKVVIKVKAETRTDAARIATTMVNSHLENREPGDLEVTAG